MKITEYINRDTFLVAACQGKRVLHLGCVGFTDCPVDDKVRLAKESLHQKISAVSDCLGVDLDAETVRQMRERSIFSNIIVGNVEELGALPGLGLFDVVVAGDIIEHLSNPGKMLDGIAPLLTPSGVLLVSTPNAMGLLGFTRYLFGRFREGQQHVLCFNPITLQQILSRHGYKVVEAMTCHQGTAAKHHGWKFKLGSWFFRRFPKVGGTLIYAAIANRDS
jgi:2-polyprenyl-3-methyl-5-hydroxy-6-metoxy-1,4-benzoquinol methylase